MPLCPVIFIKDRLYHVVRYPFSKNCLEYSYLTTSSQSKTKKFVYSNFKPH